jgi:hypothetical protein
VSLVSELRKTLYAARSIAGRLGFRVHTVAIVKHYSMGQHTGDIDVSDVVPLTEQDGYPPKVSWLDDEAITLSGLGKGAVDIGPITPSFVGGGTDLSSLTGQNLSTGDTLHLLITGPMHPDGALYRVKDITAEKALNYRIRAVPVSEYSEP